MKIAGFLISWLMALFMTADAVSHLLKPAPVVDAFARIGVPLDLSINLGVIALACVVLYLVPATAVLGAILLTGYLGGATAIQLRAGSPPFEVWFSVIVGVLVWTGLALRDQRLRALLPGRPVYSAARPSGEPFPVGPS